MTHESTEYKFWMVFAEGGQAPHKRHLHRDDAENEAARIAAKNGRPAYVLEAVCFFEVTIPPVRRVAMDETATRVEHE